MTENTPENPDEPTAGSVPPPPAAGAVPPPPSPGYSPPPPAPGYSPPPPAAPGHAAPPQPGAYPPQGAYPAPAYAGVGAPLTDADQRMWSVLSHIGGVFVSFVVPLVVWLVFKGRGAFVEDQAKEALNFQITLAIAYIVGAITAIIIVGVFILLAAAICAVVFGIIAAVKSSQGQLYRYPVCIRFIK